MLEKITIYTDKKCSYCEQVKNLLKEKNMDFTEKVTSEFTEEWYKTMDALNIGVTPTVLFKDNYFVPGRDFNNPNQLVDMLKNFNKPDLNSNGLVLERIKTLNYNIVTALQDIDRVIKNINKRLNI